MKIDGVKSYINCLIVWDLGWFSVFLSIVYIYVFINGLSSNAFNGIKHFALHS